MLPSLIEADILNSASDDPTFAGRFPRLIELLVVASLNESPQEIRFPSFATGQVKGFDGWLVSDGAKPYVPSGKVLMEFKTSARTRIKSDANADYLKRARELGDAAREVTFVFVTSRTWPGQGEDLSQWAEARRKEGKFADVRVLDATQLVSWIREHPAVGWHAAKHILRTLPPDFHAETLDDCVADFCGQFEPALPIAALVAGRESLSERLQVEGVPYGAVQHLMGDTEEEVAAFTAASLTSSLDERTLDDRKSRSLVVSDLRTARHLSQAEGLTLVLRGEASEMASHLKARNSVLVCCAFGERSVQTPLRLERASRSQFTEALINGSRTHEQAWDLAKRCGQLLCVLRRLHGDGSRMPAWARPAPEEAQAIVAAVLASSWEETYPKDQGVIERLSGKTPEQAGRIFARLRGQADALLTKVDRVWTVRAPLDAMSCLADQISADDLARFRAVVIDVFAANRQSPGRNDIFKGDQRDGFSQRLKTSIAQNILLISALGDRLGMESPAANCQQFAKELVAQMPNLKAYPGFIEAFERELPYLAEAAPEAFLTALAPLFEGENESLKWLLTPVETEFWFPRSRHVGLVWALQHLAWTEQYFHGAVTALAAMAEVDPRPEGGGGPRPLETLGNIFSSWAPQTSVSVEVRIRTLKELVHRYPLMAPSLLATLLPAVNGSVDSHGKPLFMEAREPVLTWGDRWALELEAVKLFLDKMEGLSGRACKLIDAFPAMHDDAFQVAIKGLKAASANMLEGERTATWTHLRSDLARHKQFADADWAFPAEQRALVEEILAHFEPAPFEQNLFLFEEENPDIGIADWEKSYEEVQRRRSKIVGDLLEYGDWTTIARLGSSAKQPNTVAQTLAELNLSQETYLSILRASSNTFGGMVSRVAFDIRRGGWLSLIEKQLSEDRFEWALSQLAPSAEVQSFLRTKPEQVQTAYWKSCPALFFDLSGMDLEEAAGQLLRADRAIDVVFNHSFKPAQIANSILLLDLGKAALSELSARDASSKPLNNVPFERLLKELDSRPDIDDLQITAVEWPLISVLYLDRKRSLAIRRQILKDPEYFVDVVSRVYYPSGGTRRKLSKEEEAIASAGSKALLYLSGSPFMQGGVDEESLLAWITESIARAGQSGHSELVRTMVGRALSNAPPDPDDGLWPHRKIRSILEELADERIESGLEIARYNMRKAHSDSVEFYGQHADNERKWAGLMSKWPRTKALFLRMAEHDDAMVSHARLRMQRDAEDNTL